MRGSERGRLRLIEMRAAKVRRAPCWLASAPICMTPTGPARLPADDPMLVTILEGERKGGEGDPSDTAGGRRRPKSLRRIARKQLQTDIHCTGALASMCRWRGGGRGVPHLVKPFTVCVKMRENSLEVMEMASIGLAGFLATTCVENIRSNNFVSKNIKRSNFISGPRKRDGEAERAARRKVEE
jgi:hypothetical protein